MHYGSWVREEGDKRSWWWRFRDCELHLPFKPNTTIGDVVHKHSFLSLFRPLEDTPRPWIRLLLKADLHGKSEAQIVRHTVMKFFFAANVFFEVEAEILQSIDPPPKGEYRVTMGASRTVELYEV